MADQVLYVFQGFHGRSCAYYGMFGERGHAMLCKPAMWPLSDTSASSQAGGKANGWAC